MDTFGSSDRRVGTYVDEVGYIPFVQTVDADGNIVSSSGGSKDEANSTETALGADAEFVGEWVTNNDAQFGFNLVTDQDGEFFVEFSPDGGDTITLSKKYDIQAGEARFDALVKLPGRSHRVRYVNGGTAQGSLVILTATGDGIFPFATSNRDTPKFIAYQAQGVNSETYAILVDLDDTATFPHADKGRVDLFSTFFFIDKNPNSVGQMQIGTITAIDGTDATIAYTQGVSFSSADGRSFSRDRILQHPIELGQSGGVLTSAPTQFVATGVTAVNTATPLPTVFGTATPAVGDLVIRFGYTSGGAYTATASIQYAANVSTT